MSSIRRKLLLTLIGALLIAGFTTATATFFSAQAEFNEFLDNHLQDTAESLAGTLLASRDPDALGQLTLIEGARNSELVAQVYDSSHNTVWHAHGKHPLPLPEITGFANERIEGNNWRLYSMTSGPYIITVGQNMTVRTDLAASAAFRVLQPLCFLLPFIAIAVWLVVGEGLSPLERTARSVARRSPTSLEPISTKKLPSELEALVLSINQLMDRLKESLSAQQRFASDAAHELRTPLTALKLQLQMAQRTKDPEKQAKYLEKMNDGINRATRLVEQLLTLARLDPDASERPVSTVHLEQLCEGVAEYMRPIAGQKAITISTKTEAATTEGMEDAIRLLVTNLTDNAIRYTPEAGRIELASFTEGVMSVIEIRDNGPGIAPEERQRVFDRFYRALGTKTSGTGLGLAIVKRITDIHHGQIEIDDGLDGRGTTFRIRLPRTGPTLSV